MKKDYSKINIINLLGIKNLPAFDKKELFDRMLTLIEMRSLNRVTEKLDEVNRKILFQIIENEDHDELKKFLLKNDIDFIELMEQEALKLKEELDVKVNR